MERKYAKNWEKNQNTYCNPNKLIKKKIPLLWFQSILLRENERLKEI
jgi:hypothetical protein